MWSDNSTSEWSNVSGSGPAGQSVSFTAANAGTVTIDRVTPANIAVSGGAYTFVPVSESSTGIVSSGVMTVSGESTLLNINLNNADFSGSVVMQGGTLVLGAANAIGATSSLFFNGGLLRYADGITTDVSIQIHSDSASPVRVDTGENTVTWSDGDGVKQVLSSGIEKSGSGSLTLVWTSSGDTHAGLLSVQEGILSINKVSGNGTLSGGYTGTGTIEFTSPSGQFNVSGDNSAFTGTVLLSGDGTTTSGSISFANGAALGGANTLVKVAGQRFWFASNTTTSSKFEFVDDTTTYFDGSTGRSYVFTGSVSGAGDMMVKPSCFITMSGDVSQFSGSFVHPGASAVSWLFGGDGVAGTGQVQANLQSSGGNMTYTFWYTTPTEMSGIISGSANVRQRGSGVLTLTGQNTTTGNLTIDAGTELQLGNAESSASWAGSMQQGPGLLTLVNGVLQNPLTTVEGTMVADVAAGGLVDIAGMNGNSLQQVSIAANGQLIGISGDLTVGGEAGISSLNLTLGSSNLGASAELGDGELSMLSISDGQLLIADAATVNLDMESVKNILNGQRQAVYLHIADADISLSGSMSPLDLFANSLTTPEALGLVVLGIEGGNIVLEGAVRDVYMVTEDGDYDTVTEYGRLQPYKAVFIDSGYTLSLNLPGDNTQEAWVNNLLGAGNLSVSNTDEAAGVVCVLLNNEVLVSVDGVLMPEQDAQINSANTELQGNVTAGSAVQLVKTGSGTLSIGGALTADWLELEEGTLRLAGQGNVVHSLHGSAALEVAGSLELTGNSASFSGALSGDGNLVLKGVLPGRGSVGSLQGDGQLLAVGEAFTVQNAADSVFSGSLAEGNGAGVLSVLQGPGEFTFNQVHASAVWSVQNSGTMLLQQSGSTTNSVLTLNALQLLSGSATTLVLNTDWDTEVFSFKSLTIADDATLTLQSSGSMPWELSDDGTQILGNVQSGDLGSDGIAPLTLADGISFRGIESAWLSVENGKLIFHALMNSRNYYAELAKSPNAETGAQMLWRIPNRILRDNPDLSALSRALDAMVTNGDSAAGDSLLAAVAGAGAAALGAASMSDLERQLKSIRNRTTSMGLDPQYEYDDLPLFNAWVNAEGDRRELKSKGTDAGYSLSSWGATVGVDIDFSTSFTAGFAFTGMYGDFQGKSADSAEGDMDHYYLGLFGRYVHHRWTHTLVGAFGWADVSLNRHVSFPGGHYRTHGSTDGRSYGLLYELGYVIPLDEENRACLQPIFNVSYRHTALDSFTEHGSDAALHFSSQSMDTVTFGLGARAQTYALENTMNRSSLLEARALLKLHAGDTRSDVASHLQALPGRGGRVRSADAGRVGLELGAGIAVPVGVDSGFIFLDAGFEFRADETDWNGTFGYRMNF